MSLGRGHATRLLLRLQQPDLRPTGPHRPELLRRQRLLTSPRRGAARGRLVAAALAGAWRPTPPAGRLEGQRLDRIAGLLTRSGAGGLGWWRLGRRATTGAARSLRQAYRFQAMSALQNRRGTVQAVRALRAVGLEPLLGRGAAAAVVYPEPGLRPYGDVDLYIPQEAVGDAREALRRQPSCLYVDLHAGFAPLDDRPVDELLRRAREVDLGGHVIRAFGAEDHLRLLALHFLKHGGWRPLWLCDVAALLEAEGPSLDWGYLASGDKRRTDAVLRVLALAGGLLDARLDAVPREVACRRPPRWMTEQVLRAWGNPDFVPHGCRRPIARAHGVSALLRGLRQRWPNGVEATAARGAWFDGSPRLPLQLAECLARVAGFAARRAVRQTP